MTVQKQNPTNTGKGYECCRVLLQLVPLAPQLQLEKKEVSS